MSQKYESKRNQKRRQKRRWLPVLLSLGGLVLVFGAFLALTKGKGAGQDSLDTTIVVTGAPSIKVDKEKVDLGNVKLGFPKQVSFRIANVGDQPLRFTEQPYIEVVEGC